MTARRDVEKPGAIFWAGMIIGLGVIAFGVRGLLLHLRFTRVVNLATFFGASGVAHDAVWAPLLVAGAVATSHLAVPVRRTVRVALVLSAGLVVFAFPVLHGYDGRETNPSALPLDYGRNVAAVLVTLWLGVAVVLLVKRRAARR